MCGKLLRGVAFDGKDIGQLTIESVGPKVRVARGRDELEIHPDLLACFLHAALGDGGHPELAGDVR